MRLYRVFPYDASAGPAARGGVLYVPPSRGKNRIDNPGLYETLYAAHEPEAAVAEVFGEFPIWRPATFLHAELGLPYALGTLSLPDATPIFDLDDVDALRSAGITRPTDVVTRDRARTQAWARTIFELRRHAGARWWSYYKPEWRVLGLWAYGDVVPVAAPELLTTAAASVTGAAAAIVRQISRS